MIRDVARRVRAHRDPWKFEAGTPPITEIIGLGAAVDYLTDLGMEQVRAHEQEPPTTRCVCSPTGSATTEYYGPANSADRGGVISFS